MNYRRPRNGRKYRGRVGAWDTGNYTHWREGQTTPRGWKIVRCAICGQMGALWPARIVLRRWKRGQPWRYRYVAVVFHRLSFETESISCQQEVPDA